MTTLRDLLTPGSGLLLPGAGNALVVRGGAVTLTSSGNKYFDIDCTTSNSGQNYTLTATGKTGSVVAGYEYTLDDAGAKGTTQYAGQAVTSSCWALKSASDCS